MRKKKIQPIGLCMTPSRTPLGRALRKYRLEAGLTQMEVARRASVSQSMYSALEVGTCRNTDSSRAVRIVLALGVLNTTKQRALLRLLVRKPSN
jgi:predicted transcriptional regulator